MFWAFCILSFCFRNISLSSSVIIICDGPEQKCTKLLHPILGLGPCTTRDPKSIHPASFYHLSGCKVEGRLMRVCDILRMELMAECLGKQPVFLVQERPWSPSSSTILLQWYFVLDFGTSLEGICNTEELIRAEQVSNIGNCKHF